jgi:redox-sensitive bicupin YhaK (pirin superfamily)
MIQVRRSEDRGHFDHGWLDTFHTFSFADYADPRFMGFSKLRVINQDRVQPGRGFGTHGHRNMEIISYVLDGVLEHRDSMGNGSRILPGEVQFMSAGSGVTHSEFNGSDSQVAEFLQMWILPERQGTPPRYEQRAFPETEREGKLRLMVSPDGRDGSVTIGQDARIYGSLLRPGQSVDHSLEAGHSAWIHVARGRLTLNGQSLGPGDGAGIQDETSLVISGQEPAEFVLFDLP